MKILVVVDMQNDFIDGALANKDAQAIVHGIVDMINGWDGPIFGTLDTHTSDYMLTQEGKNLPIPHCIWNTDGWRMNNDIFNAIRNKGYRNFNIMKFGFGSPDLCDQIRQIKNGLPMDNPIEEIHLVGVCTDICVISNAMLLKSFFTEIPIIVHANLCAGVTKESHNIALKAMSACQIKIDE